MQFFHASRVLVLAAGLGVGSTCSAAFITGPNALQGDPSTVTLNLADTLVGVVWGSAFESSQVISGPTGEVAGQVTLAGTIDLVGQVTFTIAVINVTDAPINFSFLFTSPVAVPQPSDGRAFTVASVLDANGDGGTIAGNHEDGGMVHYLYNTGPDLGGGVLFDSQLLTSIVAGSFSTASGSDESSPAPTFVPLAGVAVSLQADVRFSLTPHDQATVTGAFLIAVPSPGASALGVAGLMVAGRRRRTNSL